MKKINMLMLNVGQFKTVKEFIVDKTKKLSQSA